METLVLVAALAAALLAFSALLWAALKNYLRFRGRALVVCPENGQREAVELDGAYAAWMGLLGSPLLRLRDCSRWPERQDCGQACLQQIESAPQGCLVQEILARWYQGQACVFCGRTFPLLRPYDHQPALLAPQGELLEWPSLEVRRLPEILQTHRPVCWNCFIAESFRRRYPDLPVDRERAPNRSSPLPGPEQG